MPVPSELIRDKEHSSHNERLRPGSKILYVVDGSDGIEDGGITNGVKTTSIFLQKALKKKGYEVDLLYPAKTVPKGNGQLKPMYTTLGLPGYPGFNIPVGGYCATRQYILNTKPDGIYVASSDGPLGVYTSLIAAYGAITPERQPLPYVSSFTTRLDILLARQITETIYQLAEQLPQFTHSLLKSIEVSPAIFKNILKSLYTGADRIMVPTQTMIDELTKIGFEKERLVLWPRGVDKERFHLPEQDEENPYLKYDWYRDQSKPIIIYFGRVSLEKNIETLLDSSLDDFHKVIIGKGPHLEQLQGKYQDTNIHFLGAKYGHELASYIRHANVHAFTSLSDTFGNTILEAGASGIPTVGFDGVPGPQDIIKQGVSGFVIKNKEKFSEAVRLSLNVDPISCSLDITNRFSWDSAADQLIDQMKPTPFYKQDQSNNAICHNSI